MCGEQRYPAIQRGVCMMVASLFVPEPKRWGLRGDPFLWEAMRDALRDTPMPSTLAEFRNLVSASFIEQTGHRLVPSGSVFVESLAHGGMSSGQVSMEFWTEEALPLLFKRFDAQGNVLESAD